ncbi:DUF4262 domain-containing protein [Amycolatopsis rubida]|uniref:DUF4262 domain-containing protein n=1 Tax=Amycolatopsis rubida TaxID=112413 RepID=A0A1I5IXY3_9PSEU|nr:MULTISPECIES: DUF4262 domain-containing protein [Amycolatopsis]MYW91283.1 DUF4262 domain-containing protein [Amycolatopsis rubida]NEC56268.1 DUF4262 domain-containing protein [Amycolatopsis rubida]OAP28858.1 hypothetical protein A4R44_00650 [Amycolatopsis sp. M39]SFO65210.1 protein of unknown function [Amycolatopsis rubida]
MCQRCEEPERPEEQYLIEVLDEIRENGWCVQGVLGTGSRPPWAYTAGLTVQGLPELIVTGLLPHRAMRLLNAAAEQSLCTGPPVPGEQWLLPRLPRLEIVQLSAPAAHLDIAVCCYGTGIEARQLVYADSAGRFPWSPQYNSGRGGQPVLGVRRA